MNILESFVQSVEKGTTNLEAPVLPDFKNPATSTPPAKENITPPVNPQTEPKKEEVKAEVENEDLKGNNNEPPATEEELSIFDYLESKTGLQIEKPTETTYEAMASYISKLQEQTEREFEKKLEQIAPNAYKALVYEMNGGNIADLFKEKPSSLSVKLEKSDVTSQENIIKEYFNRKGIKDLSVIEQFISNSKQTENLYNQAVNFQKEMQQENKQKEESLIAQREQERKEENDRIMGFVSTLRDTIKQGKIGGFEIPEADKAQFIQYVGSKIKPMDSGKSFVAVTEIKAESLGEVLQSMFFDFKKGNLENLVKAKATTIHAKNLAFKSEQSKSVKGSEAGSTKNKEVLSSFFNKQ